MISDDDNNTSSSGISYQSIYFINDDDSPILTIIQYINNITYLRITTISQQQQE